MLYNTFILFLKNHKINQYKSLLNIHATTSGYKKHSLNKKILIKVTTIVKFHFT